MIQFIGTEDDKTYFRCLKCRSVWITSGNPRIEHVCSIIMEGPGTELEKMLKWLKVPRCSQCLQLMYKMNEWGVEGCRRHIGVIVEDISSRTIISKYLIKRTVLKAINRYEKSTILHA